jgi:hypothetical protein
MRRNLCWDRRWPRGGSFRYEQPLHRQAPFFKRLRKEVSGDTKLVAVLPHPAAEGRQYLTNLGVEVDDIAQTTLSAIGVRGTPTLLLVASSGKV